MLIGDCRRVENTQKYQSANPNYYFIRTRLDDKVEQLMLTEHEFQRALERAEKHPEDWIRINPYK